MTTKDTLPLRRIDHVRFFVGNARQSAYFYRNAFGFDVVAYAGLETRQKHEAGYVLRQGNITFVLVSALSWRHPDSQRLIQHGDGVQDIALDVENVAHTFNEAVRRGAEAVSPPQALEDEFGVYEYATIRTYGDTTHTFINRDRYKGVFSPGFKPIDPERYQPSTFQSVGLKAIDHIVGNVEEGKMNDWVKFYQDVLGFHQLVHFDDKDIATEYSALMSKVVENGTGRIKFPINEPAKAKRRSQIDEPPDARKPQERPDPATIDRYLKEFAAFKAARSRDAVAKALDDLSRAAEDDRINLFRKVVEAAEIGCTHGEITGRLRRDLGFGNPLVMA